MRFWTATNNGICHTFSEIILRVCNGKYEGVSDVSAGDDSIDLLQETSYKRPPTRDLLQETSYEETRDLLQETSSANMKELVTLVRCG
jgi:hypothetical protein